MWKIGDTGFRKEMKYHQLMQLFLIAVPVHRRRPRSRVLEVAGFCWLWVVAVIWQVDT